MDYESETRTLNANANVFKPEPGQYEIVIIGEPEKSEYVENEGTPDERRYPQIKLNIQIKQIDYCWYVAKGKTFNSLYGQLMLIGKARGKLNGEKITLLVKKSDKDNKNEYKIDEASSLIPSKEESIV